MTSYIIRRVLLIIPTVFLALSFLFFLFFLLPGNPAELLAGGNNRTVDPGVIERAEARYGLDKPIPVQFVKYWNRTIRWDLGDSYQNNRSVNEILGEHAVASLRLGIWAILIEIVVGISIGIVSAIRRYSWQDQLDDDRDRGGLGNSRVRAGLPVAIRVRRVSEQARLARVDAAEDARHRAEHLGALLHTGRGAVAISRAAGRDPRLRLDRARGAHDARVDARSPRRRLHAHRARQGTR